MKTILFYSILSFFTLTSFAQKTTISGIVTDETEMPFWGVHVTIVNGPLEGVETDENGEYSIEVEDGDSLLFNDPTGEYVTQVIVVKSDSVLDVQMLPLPPLTICVVSHGYAVEGIVRNKKGEALKGIIVYQERNSETGRSDENGGFNLESFVVNSPLFFVSPSGKYLPSQITLEKPSWNIEIVLESSRKQKRTITGTVTDDRGEPFFGVLVSIVNGPVIGVETDENGKYSIEVSEDDSLLRFVDDTGEYLTQIITIGSQTVIDVQMMVTESDCDWGLWDFEVELERYLSYDSSQLGRGMGNGDITENYKFSEFFGTTLKGQSFYLKDGNPIFNGVSNQLFSINGVPQYANQLFVHPNDIRELEINKDSRTALLNNTDALNGDISLNLKRGYNGKDYMQLSLSTAIEENISPNYSLMNSSELLAYQQGLLYNVGVNYKDSSSLLYRPDNYALRNTNFQQFAHQKKRNDAVHFFFQGGDTKRRYYLGTHYINQSEISGGTSARQLGQHFSHIHYFSDKFSTSSFLSMVWRNSSTQGEVGMHRGNLSTIAPLSLPWASSNELSNYYLANNFKRKQFASNYSFEARYDLNDNFSWINKLKGNYFNQTESNFSHPALATSFVSLIGSDSLFGAMQRKASLQNYHEFSSRLSFEKCYNYVWNIKSNAQFSTSIQNQNAHSSYEYGYNPVSWNSPKSFEDFNWRETKNNLIFSGKVTYDHRYGIEGGFKNYQHLTPLNDDNFSSFDINGVWRLSEEDFMEGVYDFFRDVALRGGFSSMSGKQLVSSFNSFLQSDVSTENYNLGVAVDPSFSRSQLYYDKEKLDVELIFRFKRNLICQISVFRQLIDFTTFSINNSSLFPFSDNEFSYSVKSKGIDCNFEYTLLNNMTIDNPTAGYILLKGNVAYNQNSVSNISEEQVVGVSELREGKSVNSLYTVKWAGVNSADGSPLWYKKNGELTDKYTLTEVQEVGQFLPQTYGSLGVQMGKSNFTLNVNFFGQLGGSFIDQRAYMLEGDGKWMEYNQSIKLAKSSWQNEGDRVDVPKQELSEKNKSSALSSRYLRSTNLLSLNRVELSYELPLGEKAKEKLQKVLFYVQGQNLKTWGGEQFYSPVVGFDHRRNRIYTVGVNMAF